MKDGANARPPIGGFGKVLHDIPDALAGVLGILPLWFWETDADHCFCYFSDGWERLSGTSTKVYLGMSRRDYFFGMTELSETARQHLDDLDNHRPFRDFVYRHEFIRGRMDWVTTSGDPVFDQDGEFMGYRGAAMILSDAVDGSQSAIEAEKKLLERTSELERAIAKRQAEMEDANQLMSEVVEAMNEGLMVTSGTDAEDPNNRIILTNKAYRSLFNLNDDDIKPGMRLRDYLHWLAKRGDASRVLQQARDVNQMLAAGETVMMEVPSTNKFFHTTAAKRPSGGYVLVHTDVTDIQEHNFELARARDAAEVANQTKSNFLATMSHEIRTPMNGIVGMADLLAETHLDGEQEEFVDTIRGSAVALTALISDILDFSKIEAGRMELAQEPFDIRALSQEIKDLLDPMVLGKSLKLLIDVKQSVPQVLVGDALRVRQVLLNLLGNAVKFTESGHVLLEITYGETLKILVKDTGIGIPVDQLTNIFDPFEQVDNSQSREHQGTGLGLAITKRLINVMKGHISVSSQLGQGTEVALSLPLKAGSRSCHHKSEPTEKSVDLAGVRILVVEDNKTNQLVVRRILERCGVEITLANNGREAVEIYKPEAFDMILMDISMPVMTGLEACREIRARQLNMGWPFRPILALTGNAFDKDHNDATAAGMDGFLTKPVRRKELLQSLSYHLQIKDQPEHPVLAILRDKQTKPNN
ncbi:ATP-binding protein [uncultured Pelagimonas sp.]|uniref:ATP-binding protein n=1 Tax=uncultured Pelagimonas sp. TaxID=1618102 RepID=UPI0026154F4A|nr:ATP-binding protein [uncultured Pelagimonas sp.]